MVLWEDSLQHAGKHGAKHEWWAAHGVEVERARFDGRHGVPVDFGDYWREGSNVVVDTKRSVDELAANLCGAAAEHARVRREAVRAARAGFRLVFLVENAHGYATLGDLLRWEPAVCASCRHRARSGRPGGCVPADRSSGKDAFFRGALCRLRSDRLGKKVRKPVGGLQLHRTCETFAQRYGCAFELCGERDSARRVCELLGVTWDA